MSFDTAKRKLYEYWQQNNKQKFELENATFLQNGKETIIVLAETTHTTFKKIRSFHSNWVPIDLVIPPNSDNFAPEEDKIANSNGAVQSSSFDITLTVPKILIPYGRLDLAYQYTDGTDIFSSTDKYPDSVSISKSSSVEDFKAPKDFFGNDVPNTKSKYFQKVTWSISLIVRKTAGKAEFETNEFPKDFSVEDFVTFLEEEGIWFETPVQYAAITRLNNLLKLNYLIDWFREWDGTIPYNLPTSMVERINNQNTTTRLTEDELMQINRALLELAYPDKCPQSGGGDEEKEEKYKPIYDFNVKFYFTLLNPS